VANGKHVEAELTVARESAERAREDADRANVTRAAFWPLLATTCARLSRASPLSIGTLRRIVTALDAADALRQQEQAIGAMSQLLNALLDISKRESGAIRPELTDFTVAALFRELRNDFANLAANKGLKLQIEDCMDYVHRACLRDEVPRGKSQVDNHESRVSSIGRYHRFVLNNRHGTKRNGQLSTRPGYSARQC
jgi:signal transduction histidine kinase